MYSTTNASTLGRSAGPAPHAIPSTRDLTVIVVLLLAVFTDLRAIVVAISEHGCFSRRLWLEPSILAYEPGIVPLARMHPWPSAFGPLCLRCLSYPRLLLPFPAQPRLIDYTQKHSRFRGTERTSSQNAIAPERTSVKRHAQRLVYPSHNSLP